jgi:hypothetical protein
MISQLTINPAGIDPSMASQINLIASKFGIDTQDYNPDIFVYDEHGEHGEERLLVGVDGKGHATELGTFTVINDRFNEELIA